MAVTYKGAYSIKGVVRHGETVADPVGPQSVDLGTFEDGTTLNQDLLSYFSRSYGSYIQTVGDEQIVDGALTTTVAGGPNNFMREFVIAGTDDNGTEIINFTYAIAPVHGLEQDYEVDFNLFTATFAPKWTEGRPLETISAGGNPGDAPYAFNEQLILYGPLPGPQDDYIWSGTLPSGLSLSADGLVTGSLSAAQDTDFGTYAVTVTNTHGAPATLQLKVMVYVLS